MSDNRSPKATPDEMQLTIDLLRARGDASVEVLETFLENLEGLVSSLRVHVKRIRDVDAQLNITKQDRVNNAVITARRMLGKIGEGKSDEEILRMVGAHEQLTNSSKNN